MYSIIDIETTGNHAHRHSITEVAIINFDGEKITDQFSTLVQPDVPIPDFISHLTGITNEMVEHAPRWEEVMEAIDDFTRNRILIAHNAHFDYSFLKSAFLQSGKSFQRKTLCTLRLSRKIFPGLQSYSLRKLCAHFNIQSQSFHRALVDAVAALELFKLCSREDRNGIIQSSLKKTPGEYTLPPHLPKEIIPSLPDEAGVYYFLDQLQRILYVGKAKNIRARIIQHFTANSSTRVRTRLMNSIHHIRYESCGNELIAMLMESAEIKKHFPPFNVIQKISENNFGVYCYEDGKGYLRFALKKLHRTDQPLISFSSLQEARVFLNEKITEFHLCPKLCNLQRSIAACHDHAAGNCDGACIGEVSAEDYNARVREALSAMKQDSITCAIVGDGRNEKERSIVIMENGKYLGYGFAPVASVGEETSVTPSPYFESLKEIIQPQRDNREVQMIIRAYLRTHSDYQLQM
ncbi:MAG TPA: exonuclease domain-containing protein [Chitinophagales bacterium]|nr:exonuclease domain-containing protein [Chitinophagales bacterium]